MAAMSLMTRAIALLVAIAIAALSTARGVQAAAAPAGEAPSNAALESDGDGDGDDDDDDDALTMAAAHPDKAGARKCNAGDVVINQKYGGEITWMVVFEVVNNCPCDASHIVANCSVGAWTQRMVNPQAILVNSPSYGSCTILPGASLHSATSGIRYGRTYTSLDILPLPINSVQFASPCNAS